MGRAFENMDDAALVALAVGGLREAFSPLLARHLPSVQRLCARLLGASLEAQDVAQEAALAAYLGLDGLSDPARFGAWLHAIAANLARMTLRRRRPLSLDALPSGLSITITWPPAPASPEEVHAARELHDTIVAALHELTPANREVAMGYFLEGYSYGELAELLGVPLSTIKGRLFKSRRVLQATLAPAAGDRAAVALHKHKEYRMTNDELIAVNVSEIRMSAWSNHRVVVLRAEDGRVVPIWVGAYEADAIAQHLGGHQPERPMTHDLALRLLTPLGAEVRRVVVNAITNSTFFAEISLVAADQTHIVDARPSDAIALAVRSGAPIFVSRAVFETCSVDDSTHDALGFTIKNVETPPSPFDPPTLHYLSQLAKAAGLEIDVPDAISWETREIELDGVTYTSITLPGDSARRLLLEPQNWTLIKERIDLVTEERRKLEALMASRREPAESASAESPA